VNLVIFPKIVVAAKHLPDTTYNADPSIIGIFARDLRLAKRIDIDRYILHTTATHSRVLIEVLSRDDAA
jgi:hypothetical protein